ncbi:MAG TPA: NADP-dependent phosphogluconate dehydrogenase [Candidatus Latescibacteria bacterium]|nr:NADP-dependent phosphogluconate dehydrogenase [Candidatus Latescibacterota bacterium]HOF61253.1 NADP-dependent phosphogluconate dehydrogenase [Candidatus Latescibacterota bacterium]HOS64163.1 NADP-dependent phosphogluconate dehydrogenase [Candidatus Latescibacterota bacterium]HPK74776.1 NADP-dependent phosphogluconate dehydrogenase [Candidatus Latescibacterota bacterium]
MKNCQFGLIGLGVMGQNFVLNVERNGCRVAVYNRTAATTKAFVEGAARGKKIQPAYTLEEFVGALERPRRIMLLVKAGEPVDDMIRRLSPLLAKGDLIIDGGNSFYRHTEKRTHEVEASGLLYLGMGVSGGEEGALWGPSLMPGGSEAAYKLVEPLLKRVAAKAGEDGKPCVAYMGPGGAGHFVKMVHNGIEYGDMQLIAEAYHLLKAVLGLTADDFSRVFAEWNEGELSSYLIELTAKVFAKKDDETGKPLVDVILDSAGQKGTGKWTTQCSLELGAPVPTITAAVDARLLSAQKQERMHAAGILPGPEPGTKRVPKKALINAVRDALYVSKICSYAQGMSLLGAASKAHSYQINLGVVAEIWRAGCIIRARLLNDIKTAYDRDAALPNLLLDEFFRDAVATRQTAWRQVLQTGIAHGVPMPAMAASLAYYDAYRSERLPANLIQAQRDFFGAHTFERIDRPGVFHVDWE